VPELSCVGRFMVAVRRRLDDPYLPKIELGSTDYESHSMGRSQGYYLAGISFHWPSW
jgi:hypothetical protein